ncbi:hypothetical protein IF1G_06782 [Cordyceps javanica]|uniref:Uncharacterized protein n=1 Tax=Cordyceps javanica TaxID=43265 RepID=A0A545UZ72_9HYPO|nr:hypothetical protein IF1G_06782 [Cordyceps javanica]
MSTSIKRRRALLAVPVSVRHGIDTPSYLGRLFSPVVQPVSRLAIASIARTHLHTHTYPNITHTEVRKRSVATGASLLARRPTTPRCTENLRVGAAHVLRGAGLTTSFFWRPSRRCSQTCHYASKPRIEL